MENVIVILLLVAIFFYTGATFYAVQKGVNELIAGLRSIDKRLSQIEENTRQSSP